MPLLAISTAYMSVATNPWQHVFRPFDGSPFIQNSTVAPVVSCRLADIGAFTEPLIPSKLKACPTSPVVLPAPPFAVAKFGPAESTPLFSARYQAAAPLGSAEHEVGVTVVVLLPVLLAVLGSDCVPDIVAESVSEPGI